MANTLNLGNGNWATKEDSLLAYNSENGNFKPLPFDFTRASSATVVNKAGLIETVGSGEPRIDFSNDAKGALLLEPQRSNLITNSESFLGTSGSASLTNSDALSPYSSINGFKISEVSTNSYQSRIYTNIGYVGGSSYTVYVFAKASTNDRFVLFGQQSSQPIVGYDLTNGAILTESNVTSSFIDNYGNGWYRCGFTYTSALTQTSQYGINLIKEGTTNTYIYNGNTNQNVLFFGASLEQGSYATSYIPTQGSAVTRSADACNNGGNEQVINSTEGVLFAEIAPLANDLTNRHIGISDDTNTNRLQIFFNIYGTTQIRTLNLVNNVKYFDMQSNVTLVNGYVKVAVKYKENDFSLWVNGVEVATDNSGLVWSNGVLDTLKFSDGNNASPFYGNTKDIRLYNTALTDAELQALTSN